jgi:hypothetical protein
VKLAVRFVVLFAAIEIIYQISWPKISQSHPYLLLFGRGDFQLVEKIGSSPPCGECALIINPFLVFTARPTNNSNEMKCKFDWHLTNESWDQISP